MIPSREAPNTRPRARPNFLRGISSREFPFSFPYVVEMGFEGGIVDADREEFGGYGELRHFRQD